MCTAAIVPSREQPGFFVVFNRDELVTRAVADPPEVHHADSGAAYIAPRDPDAGGTWIAGTARGEVLALLNNYADAERFTPTTPVQTRGAVVGWMADRDVDATVDDVFAARREALDHVRPFRLFTVYGDDAPQARLWTWTGVHLTDEPLPLPGSAISSGTRQAEAQRERSAALAETLTSAPSWPQVAARMSEHVPTNGPTALCMHRRGAQTVSQTVVEVTPDAVIMRYKSGPPCQRDTWTTVELSRG